MALVARSILTASLWVKSVVNVDFLVQVPPVVAIVTPDIDTVVATYNVPDLVSVVAGTLFILQCVKLRPFIKNADTFITTGVPMTKFVFVCVTKIDPDIGKAFSVFVPDFVIVI
jgi:hypothetical protein